MALYASLEMLRKHMSLLCAYCVPTVCLLCAYCEPTVNGVLSLPWMGVEHYDGAVHFWRARVQSIETGGHTHKMRFALCVLLLHAVHLFTGRVKDKSSQRQREQPWQSTVHTPLHPLCSMLSRRWLNLPGVPLRTPTLSFGVRGCKLHAVKALRTFVLLPSGIASPDPIVGPCGSSRAAFNWDWHRIHLRLRVSPPWTRFVCSSLFA